MATHGSHHDTGLPAWSAAPATQHADAAGYQAAVTAHFEAQSSFWEHIYEAQDVIGVIHQHRQALALSWIDALQLPRSTRVLEIGCGAGLASVALAQRGFDVYATDVNDAMIELARNRVESAGLSARVHVARVLRPGGYLLATIGNQMRLPWVLDPLLSPPLAPMRHALKRVLRRIGRPWQTSDEPHTHPLRHGEYQALLAEAGLDVVRQTSFGFGPFTLLGRKLLPDRFDVSLNARLERLAGHEDGVLRTMGAQHLALARKPEAAAS